MKKLLYTSLLIVFATAVIDDAECLRPVKRTSVVNTQPKAKKARQTPPDGMNRIRSEGRAGFDEHGPVAKKVKLTPPVGINRGRSERGAITENINIEGLGPKVKRVRQTPPDGMKRGRSEGGQVAVTENVDVDEQVPMDTN